jgi:hypothetical protein
MLLEQERHMMQQRWLSTAVFAISFTAATAAQTPSAPPLTTAVLVNLTIKSDVDRAQVVQTLPEEVRATVQLYLDGKIQQWFARGDGRGVIFIMNATTLAEAKTLTDGLPLAKAKLADFEYIPLGPLTPLRVLLAAPAAAGRQDR